MQANTFGKAFSISTFGESHGKTIGVIIDGCPAGLAIDIEFIQSELNRRKPGQSHITTSRSEEDLVEIQSGLFEGKSTGHPICLIIKNKDQKSKDYSHLKNVYRPSHADFTYDKKYGIRDYKGGGRSSARETATRVAAGAIAKLLLKHYNINIQAYVSKVHQVQIPINAVLDLSLIESNMVRCPDKETAAQMILAIEKAKAEKDSLGGVVNCQISNCPIGLGEPVFDKLSADLAKACMSIPATKGFEIGEGFSATDLKGSEHNDPFELINKQVKTSSNHSGGIQGGISNGEPILLKVAFKPTATIGAAQKSLTTDNKSITLEAKGRHDPCVVPRAVPIVEAMVALVLADHLLRYRLSKL